ncbi:heparin cofactor 2-like [Denticeps clupeoides]|uniref:Serpin domain-containing protein n=1 Tax=Denticeps clupeoides TaxID=299321 RepID=A0A8C3ZP52_9TELE|nr:heparin cofactor 2-like [Denticeps clupeoides]XP_028853046.1 heparin cofactor 2-like [Denticeps clupeoides]
MWHLILAACFLLVRPGHAGIKDLGSHFKISEGATDPRGASPGKAKEVDMESIPLDFHRENTVTSDLPVEGVEYEDYIDFDKILAMGEDDYNEGDQIDDIPTASPNLELYLEPSDQKLRRERLLRLFHSRTRLQRLNVVNARFGFALYRSLRNHVNQTDNILLAPASVSIAMGMMALGVGPSTHEQLYRTLGFAQFIDASSQYGNDTVHKLFRKLTHRLFRRNFGYTLRAVNDLYVRRNVPVSEGFSANAKAYYFAKPQSVDFSDPSFLTKANQQIQKLTKGLIKDPLKSVDPNMVLMLLNYLYFKGTWEQKFPKELTHYRNFRVSEKQQVRVPMMQNKGSYMAAADNELHCDVLQLPYNGNISMLIALPQKLSGMRTLEQEISPTVINKWLKNMTNRTREVVFPRFKLQQNYDLIPHLEGMGLTGLFEETGDFSPMTSEKIGINWFQHQSTITVNEEGTEAAALTQVGFMPLSTQARFVVDRPFLFLIYEHRTDCLVFMGRVANPLEN